MDAKCSCDCLQRPSMTSKCHSLGSGPQMDTPPFPHREIGPVSRGDFQKGIKYRCSSKAIILLTK